MTKIDTVTIYSCLFMVFWLWLVFHRTNTHLNPMPEFMCKLIIAFIPVPLFLRAIGLI